MNKDLKQLVEAYEDIQKNSSTSYSLLDTIKEKYSKEQYPYEALLGSLRGFIGLKGTDCTVKELLEALIK